MNNPFDYTPSEAMLREQERLVAHIERMCGECAAFAEEVTRGKMFGMLRCQSAAGERVLWAFSGQIGGRFEWEGFVPPVFDYLAEDGYFKIHEREITALNHRIELLENSSALLEARQELLRCRRQGESEVEAFRQQTREAKSRRNQLRADGADEAELVRESQFMKAELHRKKLFWREQVAAAEAAVEETEGLLRSLKMQRSRKSDALQQWLFGQFVFATADGSRISLSEVNAAIAAESPAPAKRAATVLLPSGTGECCEPKLLHHAYSHQLVPVEMGMFWWGESPRQEVRHHLQFYAACSGKCKPLLKFLLNDALAQPAPPAGGWKEIPIVFEDEWLLVVDKPAGMLSVPGKADAADVVATLQRQRPDLTELSAVHRLDMDTSGLLVVAKSALAHSILQNLFAWRHVEKTYVALLERPIEGEGRISLPLAPDYLDRPRQKVDPSTGKAAHTCYRSLGGNRVELRPLTGRTHQLRVHCAHQLGLGNPILGDRLYGLQEHSRLCLHAAALRFVHPLTKEELRFSSEAEF